MHRSLIHSSWSPDRTPRGIVPVTAKLSRKFYETFGDEIANDLVDWFNAVDATYRADLRELNELNFARFDAKLEQRLAELDAKWGSRWSQLDTKLEQPAGGDSRGASRYGQVDVRVLGTDRHRGHRPPPPPLGPAPRVLQHARRPSTDSQSVINKPASPPSWPS